MGYKGTIRCICSTIRAMDREAKRRQRELERQQREMERMQELERAAYEVEVYENYIEVISSIHKECGESWDWQKIKSSDPPVEPKQLKNHENEAQKSLDNYLPSFFDKTFKRIEKKKNKLIKKLKEAQALDEAEYKKVCEEFKKNYDEWKTLTELVEKICEEVIDAYPDAIKFVNPFEEIKEYGSEIKFEVKDKGFIVASIKIRDKEVIPTEVKS